MPFESIDRLSQFRTQIRELKAAQGEKGSLFEVDPDVLTPEDMAMYERIAAVTEVDEDLIHDFTKYQEAAASSTEGSPKRYAFAQWLANEITRKLKIEPPENKT